MPQVKLSNLTTFECENDLVILESARQQGIMLEHSCRNGRCGVCKARVLEGETEIVQLEESLADFDRLNGYILTCCRTAKQDVKLDIQDLGELANIQLKTLPCRIDSLKLLSPDVLEVMLRTPPTSQLEYLPGQYVEIIGRNGLRRSYSLANAPRKDGKITLHIRKVELGKMSQYWFDEAKVNDLLRLEGPLGTFCIRKNSVSRLIFLATGTGIAPIKAILEQLSASPEMNVYDQIHLYWGGRVEQDIYWQPALDGLPLVFTPVLSRTPHWQGRKGYVHQAVIEDGIDLKDSVVYACGSETMIYSANQQLIAAGLDSKSFYSDAFVSSK